MKVIVKFSLMFAAVAGVISGCATKSDINDLQNQIDVLNPDRIQTISGQIAAISNSLTSLQNTDTELKTYIETLQGQAERLEMTSANLEESIAKVKAELEDEISTAESNAVKKMEEMKSGIDAELKALNSTIETLQKKDKDLQGQIDELKSYVDTELAKAKDWANASFASLDEYKETAKIVAGIQTQIKNINDEIADVKKYTSDVKAEIEEAISALKTELQEETDEAIAALKAELIAEIETASEDAANALEGAIEEITEAYTKAIVGAITASETSIKSWVNERLTGYYTIAQMDSKIETLEQTLAAQKDELKTFIEKNADDLKNNKTGIDKNKEAITKLQESIKANTDAISELKSAIELQKEETTEAYKDYIAEAIKDGGVIGKAIQAKIDDVNEDIETLSTSVKTCQDAIASIQTDIAAIKADLESLKTDIRNVLRNLASVSYIPAYSDHVERIEYEGIEKFSVKNATAKDLTLRFDVYPENSADSIAIAFEKDSGILSARAVCTKTRANAGDFADLTILSATANDGVLSVVISAPELGNEFILGKLSSSLVLRVDTGVNLIQSEYVPLVPEAEGLAYAQYMVGSFDTTGDGRLDDDEIAVIKSLDFRNLTDISTLDLTVFPNLTDVICPSLDWLLGLDLDYNNTVTFYSPAGKKLISEHDILIDSVIWQKYNVGATESDIEGGKFTFYEAQRACPSGYRTPTRDEFAMLADNFKWIDDYSYMGGVHYGYLFCGSRDYSPDAPTVFLPPMTTSSGAAIASYWTCTKNTEDYSFYLYFEAEGQPTPYHAQKNSATFSVRCVKE